MGIFGRKDDDDEAMPTLPQPVVAPTPPVQATAPAPEKNRVRFGVDDAIQLMRSLPVDQNPELVLKVVRTTLASLNVQVADIVSDASKKQKSIQERVSALQSGIAALEKEIGDKRQEIARLDAELLETTNLRDRLQAAEAAAKPRTPPVAVTSLPPPPQSPPPEKVIVSPSLVPPRKIS